MRYAVSFQLQNRTEDLSHLSLPTLYDISHGITLEMNQLHRYHTPACKALDKLLRSTESYNDWIPEQGPDLLYDTGLNRHLGDRGIVLPGRIQDIAGARTFVASFYHPAGLVAATIKHKFTLICKAALHTGRLLLSDKISIGTRTMTNLGPKTLLIYLATPHPQCSMKHQPFFRSTIPERTKWMMGAVKLVGRLSLVPLPEYDPETLPEI